MPDTQMPEQTYLNSPRQHDPKQDPMNLERRQPDPTLGRRMGDGGMSLVAVAIVVILAIVFFGLNGRSTESTTPAQTIPLAAK
jgi:Mn2+/Fe2+ NRAMP family transporter